MPELAEQRRKANQRPSDRQLPEAWKKDSERAVTPAAEATCVPAHLAPPGSARPKQLCHLHAQPSLGQSCHGQEKQSCVYTSRVASVMSKFSVTLWTVACEASLSRGSPGENARASCHTLLEHHISCFPSLQGA